MKDFQKRLYIERFNLKRKFNKLNNAITNNSVPESAVEDLKSQSTIMDQYIGILNDRIRKIEIETGDRYEDGYLGTELDFGTAVELLEEGYVMTRSGWNGKDLVIVRQVPSHITEEIIPKIQSLPDKAKEILMENTKFIDYTCQNLIINLKTGRADSWVPSSSDMYAKDWIIIR